MVWKILNHKQTHHHGLLCVVCEQWMWQLFFISLVEQGRAGGVSNKAAIYLKNAVTRKHWDWRGIKKRTNSPFLVSLQDLRVGDCCSSQQFTLWTDGGPSA